MLTACALGFGLSFIVTLAPRAAAAKCGGQNNYCCVHYQRHYCVPSTGAAGGATFLKCQWDKPCAQAYPGDAPSCVTPSYINWDISPFCKGYCRVDCHGPGCAGDCPAGEICAAGNCKKQGCGQVVHWYDEWGTSYKIGKAPSLLDVRSMCFSKEAWAYGVKGGGTLVHWGHGNSSSTLFTDKRNTSITNAVQVACAPYHVTVLKADGTLDYWGGQSSGSYGQPPYHPPAGLKNVVAIAQNVRATGALDKDGKITLWGVDPSKVFPILQGKTGFVGLVAGGTSFVGIKADGSLVVAGDDIQTGKPFPQPPAGLKGVIKVAIGGRVAIAVKGDGSIVVWGPGAPSGQPKDLKPVVDVAVEDVRLGSWAENFRTVFALQIDGKIRVWGPLASKVKTKVEALTNVTGLDPRGGGAMFCFGQCGAISDQGCCDGDKLYRCSEGKLISEACKSGQCGFKSHKAANQCSTSGGDAPGKRSIKSCVCIPDCTGKTCGSDGCGGTCGDGTCDDNNPCTDKDACQGESCKGTPNTNKCNDGDACSTGDTCKDGTCGGTGQLDCDDANACTNDSCDAKSGCKSVANTASCSDGDVCTVGDVCKDTKCTSGTKPLDCDDGNPCTTDSCGSKGCQYANNTQACDDGSTCTATSSCKDGKCVGAGLNCDDGNPCTIDDCASPTKCAPKKARPDGTKCVDGDACHQPGKCAKSVCAGIEDVDCDDGNPCTTDTCDSKSGCANTANALACSDGDACTDKDACKGGKCVPGAALGCDDGNPCTDDSCDSKKGCVHTANTAKCDDGDVCTQTDTCKDAKCVGSDPKVCDDGKTCTHDSCNPVLGCQTAYANVACDDGDACTSGDACVKGECVGGLLPPCDDGNPCTDDSCDPKTGCVAKPNSAPCDDGDGCTVGDACAQGSCAAGKTKAKCDDGNLCTTDHCSPAKGCVYSDNALPCDDGDACTTDQCVDGSCKGKAIACDDGDPCTDDACDPKSGCTTTPNTAACEDGNHCTVGDSCKAGTCVPGKAKNCDDGNLCTVDHCFPEASKPCWHYAWEANGTACDDGNACTHSDACYDGGCKGKSHCPWSSCSLKDGKPTCDCAAGKVQVTSGPSVQCCTPNCEYKGCSDDGCGGSCGSCTAQEKCVVVGQAWTTDVYKCQPKIACYGKAPVETGCCDGRTVRRCFGVNTLQSEDCAAKGLYCGWDKAKQAYGCTATGEPAPKGAGSPAFACPASQCVPDCQGRVCGPDGCGGTCGSCTGDTVCAPLKGQCFNPCEGAAPMAGCVQQLGSSDVVTWCPAPDAKTADVQQSVCPGGVKASWDAKQGRFVCGGKDSAPKGVSSACPKICSCGVGVFTKTCGDDGCGNACGEGCAKDQVCLASGSCCTPSCKGKVCGDDGCGGSCGTCSGGLDCTPGGQCAVKDCFDAKVVSIGKCAGGKVSYCTNTQLKTIDCKAQGMACGDVQGGKLFGCFYGTPQCDANACPKDASGATGTGACRCDAGCVEAGNCCANFDLSCGPKLVGQCGDGTCNAKAEETCASCPTDCGVCKPTAGALDAPYAQRMSGRAGGRREVAAAPLDDVRPSPPGMPRRDLWLWTPQPGVVVAEPSSRIIQDISKYKATGATTIDGPTGKAYGGMTGGKPNFGRLSFIPKRTFPRPASYAHKTTGGFTVAGWVRIPKAATAHINPLASGSQMMRPGKIQHYWPQDHAVCFTSRPEDSVVHLKCPPSQASQAYHRIVAVQAYYGDVGDAQFTSVFTDGPGCEDWAAVPQSQRCDNTAITAYVEKRCKGRGSCTIDPWAEMGDPCSDAPHKPMKSQLMIRAICSPYERGAKVNLRVTRKSDGGRLELRYDPDPVTGGPDDLLAQSKAPMPVDTWTHVAMVFEPWAPSPVGGVQDGRVVLYLDGEEVGSGMPAELPPMWRWTWGAGRVRPYWQTGPGTIYKAKHPLLDHANTNLAAQADFDDLVMYGRNLGPKEIRGLVTRPATGLLRTWPTFDAERVVREQLWGGPTTAVPVQATVLRDPSVAGQGATLEAAFRGLRVAKGGLLAMPADGADLDGLDRWTLGAWVRPRDLTPGTALLTVRQGKQDRVRFEVGSACEGRSLRVVMADGSALTTGCDHGLMNDKWTFISLSQGSSSRRLAIDGYGIRAQGAQTLFSGTGQRRVRVTGSADLGWVSLYGKALSADAERAVRAQGPDVWLDGPVVSGAGGGAPGPRDLAGFANRKAKAVDQPTAQVDGADLTAAKGNFHDDGKGYVRVPARGRLAAREGSAPRHLSVVANLRLTEQPSGVATRRLLQLTEGGTVIADAHLTCASAEVDAELPKATYKTALLCSLRASRAGAKPTVHTRYNSATFLINASKLDVQLRVALSFGSQIGADISVAGMAGAQVATRQYKTLSKGTSRHRLELVKMGKVLAPSIPAGAGTAVYVPGFRPTLGYAGIWDVRLYGRALTPSERDAAVRTGCAELGCAAAGRSCGTEVVAGGATGLATQVAACGACLPGYLERNGTCAVKLPLMAPCKRDAECATGLCSAYGFCADTAKSQACIATCLAEGRRCDGSPDKPTYGFYCGGCEQHFVWNSVSQTCQWTPPKREDEPCSVGHECDSGVCAPRTTSVYGVKSDASALSKGRHTYYSNDNKPQSAGPFYSCADKAGCAVPALTSKPQMACAAKSAARCEDLNMASRVVHGTRWDGQKVTTWMCDGCSKENYAGQPLFKQAFTMLSPQACKTLYDHYFDLQTTGHKGRKGVYVGNQFYISNLPGNLDAKSLFQKESGSYGAGVKSEPEPHARGDLLEQPPSLAILRRLILKDPNPTSPLTPKTLSKLQKAGVGNELLAWSQVPEWKRRQMARRYPVEKWKWGKSTTVQYSDVMPIGACNMAKFKWRRAYNSESSYDSPFFNADFNRPVCVPNKFPNGTVCPPPGKEAQFPRSHAGEICDSGFCAADTGVCEDGFRRLEQNLGQSRNDGKSGNSGNDLGAIALNQDNGGMFRFDDADSKGLKLAKGATDRRHYLVEGHTKESISLFGATLDVLDFSILLSVTPGAAQTKDKATYKQEFLVFGIQPPTLPALPKASCGQAQWKSGEYTGASCSLTKAPISVGVEVQASAKDGAGNNTPGNDKSLPLGKDGYSGATTNLVDVGSVTLAEFEIPLPLQECPQNLKGFATVTGRACFAKETNVGPVPFKVEAELAPVATIGFGAELDSGTLEPAAVVKPGIGLEVEVKGGVGKDIGPIEVFAGIKAAITIINVALPVKFGLGFVAGMKQSQGKSSVVSDLWTVEKVVVSELELTFLKLALGVFFDVGISPVTVSLEHEFFTFAGVKLSWTLGEKVAERIKVDFQWNPLGKKHPSGAP